MFPSFRFWFRRMICTNTIKFASHQEARVLGKMIERGKKERAPRSLKPKKVTGFSHSQPYANDGNNWKMNALNKVFMQQIGEICSSSKTCNYLLESGFEITKVNTSKCRRFLYIYWIMNNHNTNNTISEESMVDLLYQAGEELQEILSTKRYMGNIPKIKFLRDLGLEKSIHVEQIFLSPEFIKDVELTHPDTLYSQFDNKPGEDLPEMRQDLLGLDHHKVKIEIRQDMERHKVFSPKGEFEQAQVDPGPLVAFDRKTFQKFYNRKKYLDLKMQRREDTTPLPKQLNDLDIENQEDLFTWEYIEENMEELMNSDEENKPE